MDLIFLVLYPLYKYHQYLDLWAVRMFVADLVEHLWKVCILVIFLCCHLLIKYTRQFCKLHHDQNHFSMKICWWSWHLTCRNRYMRWQQQQHYYLSYNHQIYNYHRILYEQLEVDYEVFDTFYCQNDNPNLVHLYPLFVWPFDIGTCYVGIDCSL